MNYPKCLFFNFLTVFFANHVLPGLDVVNATRLPHLGGDLPFALGLGFLNSLIYPLLKLTGRSRCTPHIALIALVINFLSYALLKVLPIGIHLVTLEGYFSAVLLVSIVSFVTNFLEMKARAAAAVSTLPKQDLPKF